MTTLPGVISTSDGLITDVAGDPSTAAGTFIAPGFIDIQVNGGWGHDFTADPASIWEVGRSLPETGVTTFLPTIVTAPYEVADAAIEVLRAGRPNGYLGAEPIGLHIEGPWISPDWRGAHNAEHLQLPDPDVARRWAGCGMVRMVTVAPELDGAPEVARILADRNVTVSAGHSGADFGTASIALNGPWSAVTHLFNQMTAFHHRAPGLVGAAFLSDRPCAVIVDGIHSDPSAIRLARGQLGPDRLVLITDAMQATGLGEGTYLLADREVTVGDEGPRVGMGTLAGSTLTMDRALANLIAWTEASIDEALLAATVNPARTIGLEDRGRLDVGLRADLVVLGPGLEVLRTFVAGELAYDSGDC